MSNLREFTWSARVVQWLPLAGAVAVARRSVPAAGLLLGWLLGYVVVKGSAVVATIESGSYWRLVMPALPAFALLAAADAAPRPDVPRPHGRPLSPRCRRAGPALRADCRLVVVLSLVPIVVLLVASRRAARRRSTTAARARRALADRRHHQRPRRRGRRIARRPSRPRTGTSSTWTDSTRRADTFYRVYRASPLRRVPGHGLRAARRRPLRAALGDARHDARAPVPRPEPPDRRRSTAIGVAANWLDETDRGDVFALSPPVAPRPLTAGAARSSASSRARRSASSCASRTFSSSSFESTVE